MADKPLKSITFPGLADKYMIPEIDSTLTQQGEAADAKKTGDEISDLKNTLNHKADVIYDTASGDIASFPDGADGLPVKDLTVGIEPVQSGTGDPSPTNVRPISGWTGANVSRTGKNLLPLTVDILKSANTAGTWVGNVYTINGGTYTILVDSDNNVLGIKVSGTFSANSDFIVSIKPEFDGQAIINGGVANDNNKFIFQYSNFVNSAYSIWGTDVTITKFDYSQYPNSKIYIRMNSGYTANNLIFKPMIRLASNSDPTFAPYIGTTLPISWQSEAGTVYGGTLDVTSGVLSVDRVGVYIGSLTWTYNTSYATPIFTTPLSAISAKSNSTDFMSSIYKSGFARFWESAGNDFCIASGGSNLNISDSRYTSDSDFKTAGIGQIIVCPLTTPQTYQLTLAEVVETLLGQNNIWTDCGPSTVEYPADTKLYIQKINTPTDDDMIADANIASGQYFIVNNNLYLSTAAILAGDPIKPGTNCTLTNLAAALNALNS